jgi:hypothetical protein
MKLVIHTQEYENYGAHDWDGKGDCPQYWKAKGGSEFMVTGLNADADVDAVVDCVRDRVEFRDNGFESQILGYSLEADDYLSEFERSQLEYEGRIVHPEPSVSWAQVEQEIMGPVFDLEYANWSADQDAIYYSA